MVHKSIIVYDGSNGSNWRGTYSEREKLRLKKEYKEKGYIGYLSGYRLGGSYSYGVLCFFKNKPYQSDILKRRENGFKAAKWNWL